LPLTMDGVRIIVYDLDGTIYDDTRHFDLYAREIQSYLPETVQDAFWRDYEAVVAGRHPALRVGTFYDAARDLVLEPAGGRVQRALHWDGDPLPPEVCAQLYPGPVEPDHLQVMNIGDLWWVPVAISAHYGGKTEDHKAAFLKIREVMADPDFVIRPIPGLAEAVQSLKGRVVQVLATNSPQPDSEAILRKVGLYGLFDRCYFQSHKPAGLRTILQELARDYQVPMAAILSIGDNLVNEIAPARALGCKTAFIDPFGLASPADADLIVRSMVQLLPALCQA
jgi:FMN phosphatase YigB (HAD superfamily)